ncbi:unnamed protein product [Caenorhabditis sp. 36 PRJEB53466]|nr:unnamed protein product [Caenorhabditis sp. 36 PRJEB53466]
MQSVLNFFLLIGLFQYCQSAGFLRFQLTADGDCLLHLESSYYSETVRLLAYETRSLEIYSPGSPSEISVRFHLLHHFSGRSLCDPSDHVFRLDNNGVVDSRVIDTNRVILSVRSVFECEQGYFGPQCERRSRPIEVSTAVVPTPSPLFSFEISDDVIIYFSVAFLVFLFILANCLFCCSRSGSIRSYQDTLPLEIPEIKVFSIDEYSVCTSKTEETGTEYVDALSQFTSDIKLQSIV